MSSHHWDSWLKLLTCGLSVNIFEKSGNAKTWVTDSFFVFPHRVFYTTNLQNVLLSLNFFLCVTTKLSSLLAHGLIPSLCKVWCQLNSKPFNGVCVWNGQHIRPNCCLPLGAIFCNHEKLSLLRIQCFHMFCVLFTLWSQNIVSCHSNILNLSIV